MGFQIPVVRGFASAAPSRYFCLSTFWIRWILGGDANWRNPGDLRYRSRFLPFEVKHDDLAVHRLEAANEIEHSCGRQFGDRAIPGQPQGISASSCSKSVP
jgi:hypothetical protein